MNHIYRLVWNHITHAWVCCAENAKGRGKSSGGSKSRVTGAVALAAAGVLASSLALAGPTGGQVSAGSGSIAQAGLNTTINQTSQNLAINWQGFNIAANESVRFNQPNATSVALNRVIGQDPSQILGSLSANGQVFVINPNGVLFGANAQVNVGGLVASTLNLSDADLLAGRYVFDSSSRSVDGAVVNKGSLTAAQGGYIALLAPEVRNEGVISASLGTALLAAGNKVTLNLNSGSLLGYSIDQGAINALADNQQLIQADGGQVFMSAKAADALSTAVVNNTGIIQARTVQNVAGVIKLMGDMEVGTVNVGGTLDASAPSTGNGGFIETSAAHVKIATDASITTKAASGLNGTWLIDPVDFTIAATGGDITGANLGTALASTDVTIQTGSGSVVCTGASCGSGASGNGDINVNDAVTWGSAQTLTLSAYRNIIINQSITATNAAGKLALEYGQGAGNSGNTATYNVNAPVNLMAGQNFSTKLGNNVAATTYTVITDRGVAGSTTATDLQGMQGNLAGNCVLGANIDASATSTWNSNAGFNPIGIGSTAFTGLFDGLGHTVSNLTIDRPTTNYVGLFGVVNTGAFIRNVGLVGGSITGGLFVGGLVGKNSGNVINSYATGNLSGTSGVGGLVGTNNGSVSNSYATGNVSGSRSVGGLVGINYGSTSSVSNSYATGAVSGINDVGGLVGYNMNSGSISNSYATGAVAGFFGYFGGLVGTNIGSISNSYATGAVPSGVVAGINGYVGGLAGYNIGSISNSYATGQSTSAGGTGLTTTQLQQSANFGAWDLTNTWVVYDGHSNPLLRSFMTPLTVTLGNTSKTYDGQLNSGSAPSVSYSVTPDAHLLLGTFALGGAAATAVNAGTYAASGSGLYSTAQQGGYSVTYVNSNLTINKANATVTANSDSSKTYNGVAQSVSGFTASGLVNGEAASVLTGIGATGATGTNAASYANTVTGTAGANGNYNLSFVDGTLTIDKANLVLSGSRTYDGTSIVAGSALTASGANYETFAVSGTGDVSNLASKNVQTGSTLASLTGLALGTSANGGLSNNYNALSTTGSAVTISKADLAVTGLAASSKTYDTTAIATLTGTAAVAALGADNITLGGTASGSFANKTVGTGKAVTVTGNTLSGLDAGNYNLVQQTGITAAINQADLAVSGLSANSKTYDAGTVATLTGTASVTALTGDSITLGGTAGGSFANKTVGTGKAVTVTGNTLSGTDAGNYNLVQQTGLTADISKADLAVTGLAASGKTYDAGTVAALTGTASVTALTGDSVTLGGTSSGSFANKTVGTGKAVTVTGNTLSGTDAGNYNLVQQTSLTADISKADLAVTGLAASSKTYDAGTVATLTGTAAVIALGSDSITLGGTASGSFANKTVGTGKAVTVTGNTLSGTDAGNYNLMQQTDLQADINKADLAVTGLSASSKTYDTTAIATLTGTAAVAALGSDSITLGGTASGSFANKAVGTGKAVTISGNTLSGTDAGNYNLVQQTGITADISKADLAVTGLSASSKTYDAGTVAALTGTAAVAALGSDSITLGGTASGSFANKTVGTGKAVTVTGNTLSGTDAGNYNLVQQTGLQADISKADLAVTGLAASSKTYDTTAIATLTGTAAVIALGSDSITLGGTASGSFANKTVGTGKAVTVTGNTLSGTDAGNYNLVQQTGLSATISKADLAVTGLAASGKSYDAGTVATLTGSASVTALTGDSITLGGTASGSFANKTVGTGKAVTVTGNTLAGTDAGNYNLVQQTGLSATISKADLAVTGLSASSKTYDTTAIATLTGTAAVAALGSDSITLGGTASGSFANKTVGTGKAVTVTGNTLSGTDAGNYNLVQQTGITAAINQADLAVSGLSANSKTYDAGTVATLTGTASVTALTGDSVTLGGTASGSFANKTVGTGKAVTVTGNTLSGTDAGNYNLVQQTGLTADISKADLAVTGLAASSKTYDTTAITTLTGTAAVAALGSDSITLSGTASGSFANKTVGTGKAVTVTGNTLSGTDAGNYNLVQQTGLQADISKDDLAVTGLAASSKTYDTTAIATLTGTAAVIALGSDSITLGGSASGSFANKTVGTGKTVTVSGNTLSGTDAGNYTLVQQTGLQADISKADLAVTGLAASSKTYDAGTVAALTGTAAVAALGSDSITLGGTASGSFANKTVGTGKAVTVTGNTLSGTDADNYNLVQQTGLSATISKADLAVTGLSASSKIYDTTAIATLTGTAVVAALGSDSITLSGSAVGAFANKNAGTAKAVTVTGNTLSGTDADNYNLVQQTSLTADISKADLAMTGLAASSKTYDTTAIATLTGTAAVAALGADNITLGGTASGSFANKTVGTGKAVTVSGNTLSGLDAGNYNLVQQTGIKATISKADLAVTGLAASSKTYDTTAIATLTGTAAVAALGSDSITLGGSAVGAFANKNAGTAKAVTVTGNTLSGTDAGNYNLLQQTGLSADISKADLAVTGLSASSKTYDAGTVAALTGTAAVAALGSDSITLGGTASGSFANKTVGTGKAVTVSGNTLSGTDAGNYNLVQQTSLTADISKADLAVTGLSASSKTYDAGTVATLTGTAAVIALGSDSITLGGTASGSFANKTVGTGKAVTVTGNTLSGTDAGNYNLVQQTGLQADISKADLAVTGLAASSKTYDTTAIATLTGTAAVAALGSDSITLGGTASGSFANKTVGTGKAVTVTGNTLSGTDAGNYNLVQQTSLTADISKADLAVTGLAASSKTYDTTAIATLTGTAAVAALGSDSITLSGSAVGAFANKNAGTAKAVTVTGNTLSGTDADNYNLVQQTSLTADISKADLAVTGLAASSKTYDTTAIATLTGTAAVAALGADNITLGGTASGSFANKTVGTGKAVTVTGNTLSGTDAGNYNLVQQTGLQADISKADLAVTGLSASSKTYDTTAIATLTGTAAVTTLGTDSVSLGGSAVGAFANKSAGTAKAVTVTGNTLSGTDAGNYNLVQQTGLSASISKADLAVTGLAVSSKTYDAGTAATLTGTAAVTALGSDSITLGGSAVGAFANKNAGTGKAVTVTGNTLSGTDAGNYNLMQQTGLQADINKADLAVTGLSASSKTYDTTAIATLTGTAAVAALGSDSITLGGTAVGAFANKTVGTGKAVTVSGNTLSGTDAGNYNLVQQTGLSATISKADLAVTGLAASSKTYDTTAIATLTGTAAVTALGSDSVSLGGSAVGAFANKNAGTAKAVTVTGNTLSGTDAGNYNLLQQTGLSADISKADLAVTGLSASSKTYDATTASTLTGTASVAALMSDQVTLVGMARGEFADKNIGTNIAVTVSGNTLSGLDAGNYNLVQQTGLKANITTSEPIIAAQVTLAQMNSKAVKADVTNRSDKTSQIGFTDKPQSQTAPIAIVGEGQRLPEGLQPLSAL